MFFFIGLTMATIQGAYARRIRPGREIAAVKQVWSSPGLGAGGAHALRRQQGLSDGLYRPQAILLLIPASLFCQYDVPQDSDRAQSMSLLP